MWFREAKASPDVRAVTKTMLLLPAQALGPRHPLLVSLWSLVPEAHHLCITAQIYTRPALLFNDNSLHLPTLAVS